MPPIELETQDKLDYTWFPAGTNGTVFRVKAAHDGHIALTSGEGESDPMLEVFIGGWKNTKSVIRRNRSKPDVVEMDTPDILNEGEYRGFWIRWDGPLISVGKEGEGSPFMRYETPEPYPINFIGVCTGWGATGSWIIESPSEPMRGAAVWISASGGEVPEGAFQGGVDNGEPLFVARGHHGGALLPGKLCRSHGVCYVPWGGAEHPVESYEVLVGFGNWVHTSGSAIPPNAFPGGESEEGEPLFIGRVPHEGTMTVGKVQASHGSCYISYAGQELAFTDFEVLTV